MTSTEAWAVLFGLCILTMAGALILHVWLFSEFYWTTQIFITSAILSCVFFIFYRGSKL